MDNNLHPVMDYLSKVGDTGAHCVPCGEAASSGPWVGVTGQGRKHRLRDKVISVYGNRWTPNVVLWTTK